MPKHSFFRFQYCESKGGFVFEPNTEYEAWLVWINKHLIGIGYYQFWIGLTKMPPHQEWKWDSGTTVTWTNWYDGHPEEDEGDCVFARPFGERKNYNWVDQPCQNKYYDFVLCEA